MSSETLDFAGDEVTGDDTLSLTIDYNEVKHLVTGITLDGSGRYFLVEGCVSSEQQLLAGLSAGVESTGYLDTSEGAVCKVSAVFTGERNALGYALVYDGRAYLSETVYVSLAAAVVTSLDSIVEETVNRVIVVLVVLCCIYTSLGRNGVGAPGRVGDAENLDIVSQLAKRCGCGCSSKTGTYDYNLKFSLVVWRYNSDFSLALGPFFSKGSVRNLRNEFFVGHILIFRLNLQFYAFFHSLSKKISGFFRRRRLHIFIEPKVTVCKFRGHASPLGPHYESFLYKEWLIYLFQRSGILAD